MLTDILGAAGINKHSIIRVAGPAGLAALLWFARHDYRQVGFIRSNCNQASDGDLLLVPQTCSIGALEELLCPGPRVRLGGVLIVQTREPAAGDSPDPAHVLLARCGYDVERCVHGRRRELHVARRRVQMALAA